MPIFKNSIKNQIVIFIHIPKCGGMTFRSILGNQYKSQMTFTVNGFSNFSKSMETFKNLSQEEYKNIKLLQGHMFFGLHEYFSLPTTYITIMRNPIDRIITQYSYILQEPNHYLHQEVIKHQMNLNDYICSGISTEINNSQTRLLSGIRDIDFGKCSAEMLEIAKFNLKSYFTVVGILERFDQTLILSAKKLGWNMAFYVKLNRTKNFYRQLDIDQETLLNIAEINKLDIELYSYAQQLFQTQIYQEKRFLRDLKLFKSLNYLYKLGIEAKERAICLRNVG